MKKMLKVIVYLLLIIVIIIICLFYITPTISPFYCNKYSGEYLLMGDGSLETECFKKGCKVKEIKDVVLSDTEKNNLNTALNNRADIIPIVEFKCIKP